MFVLDRWPAQITKNNVEHLCCWFQTRSSRRRRATLTPRCGRSAGRSPSRGRCTDCAPRPRSTARSWRHSARPPSPAPVSSGSPHALRAREVGAVDKVIIHGARMHRRVNSFGCVFVHGLVGCPLVAQGSEICETVLGERQLCRPQFDVHLDEDKVAKL